MPDPGQKRGTGSSACCSAKIHSPPTPDLPPVPPLNFPNPPQQPTHPHIHPHLSCSGAAWVGHGQTCRASSCANSSTAPDTNEPFTLQQRDKMAADHKIHCSMPRVKLGHNVRKIKAEHKASRLSGRTSHQQFQSLIFFHHMTNSCWTKNMLSCWGKVTQKRWKFHGLDVASPLQILSLHLAGYVGEQLQQISMQRQFHK